MSDVLTPAGERLEFGEFQLDIVSGELSRDGSSTVLQEQSLRLLAALVNRPGDVLTRETLIDALWPDGVHVEFDRCLNTAVRRLRESLGDCATTPRYIETVGRRGYRFIAPVRVAGTATARRTGIAVLPFVNLTDDPHHDYLAEAIADDLTTELSNVTAFKVISRTSSMHFADAHESAPRMAELLGIDLVIEGSLRRMDRRVRVTARVIDARREGQIWSGSFERDASDMFGLQRQLALQLATAIAPDLPAGERTKLGRKGTADLEAYQLYVQGRHCMLSRMTEEGLRAAIEHFEAAAARDPLYALPHAGLAFAHMCIAGGYGAPGTNAEAAVQSRREVDRALALDPSLPEGHGVDACLRFWQELDHTGAERAFKRAFALGPESAELLDTYGLLLSSLRRYDEALAVQRRAHELDPVAAVVMSDIATTLLRAGRYDEALEQARAVVSLAPAFPMGHSTEGWALIKQRDFENGVRALERAVDLAPGNIMFVGQLGQACAIAGDKVRAQKILERLLTLHASHPCPYYLAYVYTGLREYERAIDCLEESFRERNGGVYGVGGSFLFEALREHPRFVALLRRMGVG